jgi:hypothetical protein
MCGINIYINPGDEFQNVTIFDSLGSAVGQFQRLAQPLVENGVTYTYSVTVQVREGVGFVLQGQPTSGNTGGSFLPLYTVKLQPISTPLTLINGWTNAPFSTSVATVEELAGIVYLKGAIASGTGQPFVLPAGFRPATDVYVPVDLCGATNGRLHITPSGTVDIQAQGGTFSNAQCFTSLDGASFAPAGSGFTPLTLINGWTNAPFSTSNAAVQNLDGIVHFKGAIASGTGQPFVLPLGFRPATDVYVPIDLCGANNGRLHITPSGTVDIQAEGGTVSNAQCFTSLDGASFAPADRGFTPLTLINGWTNAPFSTSNAAVQNLDGIVHFKGAIASGTGQPFVLPFGFRPATDVYVPADLCGANNGRLHITPSGTVDIQAEGGTVSNAQCFTSLDGASFAQ